MLKIASASEEHRGAALMQAWAGRGAARVLYAASNALLLERAVGTRSLIEMSATGHDSEATRVICCVAHTLHSSLAVGDAPSTLVPLCHWSRELPAAALRWPGKLQASAHSMQELLGTERDLVVLHGDLHHGNVLDFADRGWLAIDPKGLLGERGYDFANIFCNPNRAVALASRRLLEQAHVVASAAGLEMKRLLNWILAYAGLSAAWSLNDEREDPSLALDVVELARAALLSI